MANDLKWVDAMGVPGKAADAAYITQYQNSSNYPDPATIANLSSMFYHLSTSAPQSGLSCKVDGVVTPCKDVGKWGEIKSLTVHPGRTGPLNVSELGFLGSWRREQSNNGVSIPGAKDVPVSGKDDVWWEWVGGSGAQQDDRTTVYTIPLPAFFEDHFSTLLTGPCGTFVSDLITEAAKISRQRPYSKYPEVVLDAILGQNGVQLQPNPTIREKTPGGWIDKGVGGYAHGSVNKGTAGIVLEATQITTDSPWYRSLPSNEQERISKQDGARIKSAQALKSGPEVRTHLINQRVRTS